MPFSVLMSVYARERAEYLDECLDSLAGQILPADEIVLVEDGPLPKSLLEVIERFRSKLPIKSVRLPENRGLAAALNAGLAECSHELVARMDSDDIALPHRFAVQIPAMEAASDAAASSAWLQEFDEQRNVVATRRVPLTHAEIIRFARRRNPLSHPATVFRKSCVEAVGGYPLLYPEDYALWSRMLQAGMHMYNLNDVVLLMRTDPNFIRRRGWRFLWGEIGVIRYQYSIGFINMRDAVASIGIRVAIRSVPPAVRKLLYRIAR